MAEARCTPAAQIQMCISSSQIIPILEFLTPGLMFSIAGLCVCLIT